MMLEHIFFWFHSRTYLTLMRFLLFLVCTGGENECAYSLNFLFHTGFHLSLFCVNYFCCFHFIHLFSIACLVFSDKAVSGLSTSFFSLGKHTSYTYNNPCILTFLSLLYLFIRRMSPNYLI